MTVGNSVHSFTFKFSRNGMLPFGASDGKESTCNTGDLGSIHSLGRSPGEGNGYPLQYSGLQNSVDRGAWQATVNGFTVSQTQLSNFHFHFCGLSHPKSQEKQ